MEAFHVIFKTLRKKSGLTQAEFGKQIGVSGSAVSEYENGKSRPDLDRIPQIAQVLGVSVDTLLGDVIITHVPSELYTDVPYLSVKGQASIPSLTHNECSLSWIEETFPVILPEELKKKKLLVIEILGDSMEPGIKSGAIVLASQISANDIRYESGGVYSVLYANRFVVKRIKTNTLSTTKTLVLHSDNERFDEIVVDDSDIQCVWKVTNKLWEAVQ